MYKNYVNILLDIEYMEMLRSVRQYLMKVHTRLLGSVVMWMVNYMELRQCVREEVWW
jgi:hypothetical protein